MPANDYVRARIDPTIKTEAIGVLASMGLTVSDAFRMMMTRIAAEKRLPFDLDEEPNELTRITIEKARRGEDLHYAKDAGDLFRQLGI
jgi:DNA-damage-inducible protein J